ncbi:MAG: DUF2190 family protein [Dehalococcoidales bacterium]|nr:DUF2190 family protein [Dehalococcoidales bacterium]
MTLGGNNFKLRSSTHNDPYASFEIEADTDLTAGQMVKCNDTVCVVVNDTDDGDQAVKVYWAAKIVVPCAVVTSGNLSGYAEGCKVYFDEVDEEVNTSSAGNTLCGIVTKQPSVGDEEVEIHLDGMLGIVS